MTDMENITTDDYCTRDRISAVTFPVVTNLLLAPPARQQPRTTMPPLTSPSFPSSIISSPSLHCHMQDASSQLTRTDRLLDIIDSVLTLVGEDDFFETCQPDVEQKHGKDRIVSTRPFQ